MSDDPVSVLLVEDSPIDASFVRESLAEAPVERFEVVHCGDLSAALEYLRSSTPDVILLDLGLPDSVGLNTLTQIRAQAADSVCIVFTGLADAAPALAALRQGADDYLIKGQANSDMLVRTIRNATQRNRSAREVGEASEKFYTLFNHSQDGIFIINPDTDEIIAINPRACAMLEYTAKELLALPISAIHPNEMPQFMDFAQRISQNGAGWTDELTCITKSGQTLHVEISASVIEWNGTPCIMGILRDISARLRVEEQLRESESNYRALYESTPVMMHSTDSSGRVVSVNSHWLEVMGYDRGEVIGRRSVDFFTEESRRYAVDVIIPKVFEQGSAEDVEYQMVKKNGEVIDALMSAKVVPNHSEERAVALVFAIDVTERKRAEEMLMQQMQQRTVIEERNRLAREIHDSLAQSLLGTVINLEVAESLLDTDPTKARAEIESASILARESLEEARRSVWELQPSVLALSGLTEAIQQEVNKTGERGIQISLETRGEESDLLDQRNKLAILRIVQEALSNIIRHARTRSASVRISYGPSELRLSVTDDGIGFDSSASHGVLSSTGTGFGLISMQERARLAGGHIEIQSTLDIGTRVEATIPYQPNSGSRSALEETSTALNLLQPGSPGVIRILIADDHEVVRRGILNTIEQINGMMVVGEAEDGEQAIQKIQTLAPDVVLLDIRMPKLDGVGTLRRISELGLQTRVIILSVYATDEYIFDGLRAGAGGYLLKDVSKDDLANAIRTVHEGGSLLHPVVAKRLIEQLDNREASGLSDKEIEVIRLLASGDRDKEIATQLSVTNHTVKFHLKNVYRKLGVRTRAEAVRVATERGLLTA